MASRRVVLLVSGLPQEHAGHVQAPPSCAREGARAFLRPPARNKPYRRRGISLHLSYGSSLELRLLLPERLDEKATAIVRPVRDRPITDLPDLVQRLRQLEALGLPVTVYPDAEEYIESQLKQQRIAATVAEIRRNPKTHPLRHSLLKVELLPYQLDGIAFAAGAGRAILADDMGLGKTIQGIGVAEFLAREAEHREGADRLPGVAQIPVAQRNSALLDARRARSCSAAPPPRAAQYENDAFFTICNYEQVLRDITAIETRQLGSDHSR